MEEISRCLNLEKLLHCYKFTVTIESLKALRKLQKFGHLPNNVELFKDYACYGQFHGKDEVEYVFELFVGIFLEVSIKIIFLCTDVRLAALEAIIDYTKTDGKLEDVDYIFDMLENDPNPKMRHDLTRLIVTSLSEKSVRKQITLSLQKLIAPI